jgi:hypothetical protein
MRATAARFRPNTCTIKQISRSKSGSDRTVSYSDLASGVSCRVEPFSSSAPQEKVIASKKQGISLYRIALPFDQAIQNDYRIVVTGGDTYEVLGTLDAGAWTIELYAICAKVGQED